MNYMLFIFSSCMHADATDYKREKFQRYPYICTYIYIQYISICTFIYTYVYSLCMYVCTYVHIHIAVELIWQLGKYGKPPNLILINLIIIIMLFS